MEKKNNKKGFTLAELLIVVAIIAVLVAIAIPVFTAQLEKSREATDMANIRSAYAEIAVKAIDDSKTSKKVTVKKQQTQADWQTSNKDEIKIAGIALTDIKSDDDTEIEYVPANGSTEAKITIDSKEAKGSFEEAAAGGEGE